MSTPELELIQFQYSHFNEKARWALDWKRLPHTRTSLLPGPHMIKVRNMTGQTSTPVLRMGDRYVPGSAAIIEALEHLSPDQPLYPSNIDDRQRALDLQDWLDRKLGPYIRRALFSVSLSETAYITGMFSEGRSWPVRFLYRTSFPLARGLIKKGNGIKGQESIERAFSQTHSIFDELLKEISPGGYLVGNQFTLADLTAASLAAVAFDPPDSPMERPRPMPQPMKDWLAQWQDHGLAKYVLRIYREHR